MNFLPRRARSQGGNALFLILVAVALFAALAYAVTTSGRGSGSIGREQAAIKAAQIVQTGAVFRSVVQRMILNGTKVQDLKFNNGTPCYTSGTPSVCTSGEDCLFAPEGGGAVMPALPQDIGAASPEVCLSDNTDPDWTWSVEGQGLDLSGTPPTATGMDFYYSVDNLSTPICAAINKGLGIAGIPGIDNDGDRMIDDMPEIIGHDAFCFGTDHGSGDNTHAYVQVLVAQ